MFVRDYMTKHPLMAEPTMPVFEAQGYMGEHNVRHLPVVDDGKRLLGLVTRQTLLIQPAKLTSLNVWEITRYLSSLTVGDVMVKKKDVETIHPDATIEDAAQVMADQKIGCLPVLVEEDVVAGILTEIDLLVQLTNLLGGGVAGIRATVRVPDRIGEFAKITSAIAAEGWGIYASGGVPAPKDPEHWDVIMKLRNVPQDKLITVLEQIRDQEIIDVRETG